jgi:eukaryotic-like serine/threonine-protein kinase
MKESAGLYSAGDALWDAAYGNCRSAKPAVARTLALTQGRRALSWSALAVALCGESGQALHLAEDMARRYPQDSFYRTSWLPMVHAALAIRRNDPAAAVVLLKGPGRAEMGTNAALWPAYLRGLAHLDQGADAEARVEFQKVLDHRGVLAPKDFNPVSMTLYPLASLGLARALARTGDMDESRKAYEELFTLWKDADRDVPVLRTATQEYRRLGVSRAVRGNQRGNAGPGS